MRDPQKEVAQVREDVARSSARFRTAQKALTATTAKDSSGAVTVTIDAAGRISTILVSMTWRNSYSARTLANGVTEAVGAAVAEQINAWGNTLVDDDAARSGPELPGPPVSELADQLSEVASRNPSDHPEESMQIIRDLLDEVIESIDQVQAQIRAHLDREYEGRSGSGHAKARVLGNGTLVDLTLDAGWAESAHPTNVGRESTQAVHDAYRQIGERGVDAIIADSPLGRMNRLSQDPVALARTFGLSR